MIDEQKILDQLDFHVMDAMDSIAGGSSPKTCIDLLDAAMEHETFCNAIGVKTPLKYSKVLYKVRDLYLTVHPELMERCSSLWNDDLEDLNPSEEKQAWAGSMIRMALGSIYQVEISDECDLPVCESFESSLNPSDDELEETVEFLRLFSVDD